MKRNILTAAMIFGGLMMTACDKENANEQLGIPENAIRLTTEGFASNTKTSVNAESVQWVSGDEVTINGRAYTVTVSDGKAYIDGSGITSGALYGYYTCGTVTNPQTASPTVTVPDSYSSHYSGGRQVIALPMVAYSPSKGDNIKFQHVTAAVGVKVKNQISGTTLVLDRVVVSSSAYKVSGTAPVTLAADAAPTVGTQSGSGSVTVSFTDAPTIAYDAVREVQVPILPIGSSGTITVEVYTHDNAKNVYVYTHTVDASTLNGGNGLGRNVMLTAGCLVNTANATTSTIAGAIHGLFTINSSGDHVWFSRGNLQATTTDLGSNWTWSFATNQYDKIGNATANTKISGNGTVSENGTVDLFGWSTATTHFGISSSTGIDDYSGDFVDWGTNAISNGGNTANMWRTLTKDEWEYLINTRTASYGRFAKAYLFGSIHGIILFPDNYTHPSDVTEPTGIDATDNTSWDNNNYNAEQWAKMEAAGAVFLSAAGSRYGTDFVSTSYGYWSSTAYGDQGRAAYYLNFNGNNLSVTDMSRYYGYSVRLVRDAN